ncbi:hypothetical protein ACSNOI_04605 [Actinomadura kijaniata]|uniref:hypothetical protein n=1 Tax=Actinomadura kijaniata TaxID=46161 RepID=UPI003F1D969F
MDPQEAQLALRDIDAHGRQAVRRARPPWWHTAGEAGLAFALAASGDLNPGGHGIGPVIAMAAFISLRVALDEAAERYMGVRLRRTARTTALNIASIVLTITVVLAGAWGFGKLGVPLPATLTGACLAALVIVLAKLRHRAHQASLRR